MKALYKPMLLAGMLSGTYNPVGPYVINMDLTHRCNLNCPWCRFHSNHLKEKRVNTGADRDIKVEHFTSACRDLAAMGTRCIQYVGRGESFLHPEYTRLNAIAKGFGLEVRQFTNGTLFDQQRLEQLVDGQVDEVVIALWATNRENYAKLHGLGTEERFDRIIEGIERLNRTKAARNSEYPHVVFSYAMTAVGLDELDSFLKMTQRLGASRLHFSVVSIGAGMESFRQEAPTRQDELEALRRLRELAPKVLATGIEHNLKQVYARLEYGQDCWLKVPCNIGWFFCAISVNGDVTSCSRHNAVMGNLETQSFRSIWNSEKYRRFRKLSRDPKELVKLSMDDNCNHCCHLPHNLNIYKLLRWWPPARGCAA